MNTLQPVIISEFNKNISIRFKNILDGFDLYKNFQITGTDLYDFECNMINFLNEILKINNNHCYIDLYLTSLTLDEKYNLLNICAEEDKTILLKHINLNHDNPYYKVSSEALIPFLVRLNTREAFFVTFYFTHIPLTVWGNYNLIFPCFTNNEANNKYYYDIALRNNLIIK